MRCTVFALQFNEHGIEGVVPKELLTEAVRLQMYPPTAVPKRIPPPARSGDGKAGGGAEKEAGVKVERGSEQVGGIYFYFFKQKGKNGVS